MKNVATGIGLAALGLGVAVNGLNLTGNQASATPAGFNAGPVEPTIVWYDVVPVIYNNVLRSTIIYHAWSDGTIEARAHRGGSLYASADCDSSLSDCTNAWIVIASPNEGLNAAADINFDERVDAADLGRLLAAWGDAPRNDYPPSDCPVGLIP